MTGPDTSVKVHEAGPEDAGRVAVVLAETFYYGDLAGWLVPNEQARRRTYRPYFQMLVSQAQLCGTVEMTEDGNGVALWFERGTKPLPAIPHYRRRLADIMGDYVDGFHTLDEATEENHPAGPPHHYLAHLAVHPDAQGHGIGSRLLAHHHAIADAQDMPCYLEATGPRNQALYLRHGYRRRPSFTLGGPRGPAMFPMWRFPGGGHDSDDGERW